MARNGENQRLRAQYTELERQEQQCVAELKRTRERILTTMVSDLASETIPMRRMGARL